MKVRNCLLGFIPIANECAEYIVLPCQDSYVVRVLCEYCGLIVCVRNAIRTAVHCDLDNLPGGRVLSLSSSGCNWSCSYCQNYEISQRREIMGDHAVRVGSEGCLQERE